MMNKKPVLTRGEEEVMRILWKLERAIVSQIIELAPEPKPKYTTVATFLKILEKKGFVDHEAIGKIYRYYPVVSKEDYAQRMMSTMISNYFDGSWSQMLSFFSEREQITVEELEKLTEMVRAAKK